ncbi:MAG: RluA family pseudouridine synthase [Clostridia bacterium]|nr:RluA family pseudouridine synthase [Clostridia bacterium]
MEHIEFVIEKEPVLRIDSALVELLPGFTRSAIARLIASGYVLVNDKPVSKSYKVSVGERVTVHVPEPEPDCAVPENIPLDIVYEDDDLLVVNKPKGMVVHPAPGNYTGTLVNALLYHCGNSLSGIGGVIRPGIVHRIDKDTSGLLMVAKNDKAHVFLADQIKNHTFSREYATVVYGRVKNATGTVNAPIGRHPVDRKKQAVTEKNSKHAVTHYQVMEYFRGYTRLQCKLETGRTHQIRVHMAYMGHPVCGDLVYGGRLAEKSGLNGQCLHAQKLGFIHPSTGEYMVFEAPLPSYFVDFLSRLPKEV